ncbi:MAG TPA: GNAT family protein, partial [Anaerolineales bacterium]
LIGDVGFCPISGSHGQAYLGFTLARQYWNQGYALEATTAVLNYLFGELKLHRVIADCDTENTGSFRLLERLGFRREAHHCESYWLGDHWGDEYVYALLEREWAAEKGSAPQA